MSDKIRTMLNGWFMWNEGHQPPVPPPVGGAPSVDWEAIIDARVTALRSSLELKSNTEVCVTTYVSMSITVCVCAELST